jgi:hypothetical protein
MIKDVVNLSTIGTENLSQCEIEEVDTPSTISVNSLESVNSSPEESIAPEEPSAEPTEPTAQSVPPIAPPEPDAELVNEIVAKVQKAIAENDAGAANEIARNIINLDSTGRLKEAIKKLLNPEENEVFRSLANAKRKQSQPQPVESPVQISDTSSQSQPEAEIETEPTDPEVVEDVE